MITIKDTLGNVRFSTEINTGSRRKFSLMSEDYIVLKFSVEDPVYFKLGDYTDTELGLFELVDLYKPTLNDSTGAYDYELRLDAHYYKWKNKIFKFNPEVGGSEAGWKLTATLDVHLGVFLRNLSALGYTYKGTPFEVNIDSTVAKTSKLIVYDNTNLIDALTQMAETWECEWWVEDNQIRFGRCEFGDPVDFVINENVERMPREESKATFATRVYAFGSTRNIPNDYRPVDESVVVNGIVQKRLMMPTGVSYVDAYPDMTTEEAVEDVVIFDDIYPRRTGTMSSVTPVERTENVENEDGSTTQQKYTVYQFKDTGITFSKDYILPGEELRIVFQTGAMAGMDFAVTFNPDNLPEKLEDGSWNPQAQLWEIVRNEDYGRMLPADTLIPANGDTYNLYGFDSTSPVFEDMIKRAEEELEEKARDYVEKTKIDPNTYPCTMMSDYMYNDGNVRTNEFTVGARINLINPAYFENGRVSRVIGFEFDLDVPYSSPTFTIGETASYSRIGEIEDKVDELTYKGQVFTGTGSGVYVIGTNDNTPPTNKNVYSALKILREFVRYQGWVDQPVRKSDAVKFNSVTSPLFVFNELTTPEFVSGLLGAGTRLKDNHLELDEITVRKRMNVFELFIQRVRAVGGQLLLSPASIKISTVEELENGYKCSFNTDDQTIPEPFVLNDQAFHQTFTGKGINRYWRLTTEAGDDYFVLSKTDCEPGSGIPQPGDEVILLGNRTDKARQSAMMLSAYGNDAPYLDTYDGINDYNLSGKLLTREGNLTGIVDEVFGQLSGSGFYGKNVYLRGKFALSSGVSVDDKFGQTDSQMNNLQGQLTNQQGQLNTQQGQITSLQTDILAIPGQIKQEVSQTVTYEVGNLQIGMVNLLKGSNVELNAQAYLLGNYYYDKKPEVGKEYTIVMCYTLGSNNTNIAVYQDSYMQVAARFETKGDKIIESKSFIFNPVRDSEDMGFYQLPDGTYGSKVHWAVLVEGNKGPNAWIPSLSEQGQEAAKDAQSAANAAQSAANQAQADANAANSKLATWASDNYISPQEKTGLKQQKSDIQAEEKDIEANANRYGISLASYMAAYNAAIAALNKYTATSPENIQVIQSEYNNIAAYYPARQTILNSIAAAAKAQADKATGSIGMDGGKMLYKDPEFKKGYNGVSVYHAQNNGGKVMLTRIMKSTGNTSNGDYTSSEAAHIKEEAAGSPHNGSDWCLYIRAYGGTTTSHLGGFGFGNQSRANAVFIVKVSAKIPVGYTLKNAHNAHGDNYKQEFLTSMAGTGKYETYIFKETCGSTGTFSSVNWLYLSGPVKPESDPLEWFVDYVTVFDMTADGYGDIVDTVTTEFNTKIDQKADSVTVSAMRTDLNSLGQVVNQQGSQLQVNTNSIDAIVTKNGSGTIVSIKPEMVEITGTTVIKNKSGNKIEFFGTGTDIFNVNNGAFRVDKDGNGVFKGHIEATSGTFNGTITALNGKIGDFEITSFGSNNDAGRWITASNRTMGLSGSQLYFDKSDRIVYVGSHPNEASGGSPILGYFNIGPTTPTLKSTEKCALYASAPKHSSYLIRSYALYAETGDVRIVDGCFGGKIKNINLYGTSAEMDCDFIIGIIALIASDNMALYIRPGFLGQIIELLNYTTRRARILRNDNNGLATMLRADKTTRLYYNGNTWLPITTGNLYET